MITRKQETSQYSAALNVAWRCGSGTYKSEHAAVLALQRRCRGLSRTDAEAILQRAKEVLAMAKAQMGTKVTILNDISARQKTVGASDIHFPDIEEALGSAFPDVPMSDIRGAIWLSAIWHLL